MIFGLGFYGGSLVELVNELDNHIKSNNKVSVFTPNVDHIINNYNDKIAEEIYKESEYIIADGWPLVAVGKIKKETINRITGVDLMDELLKLSNNERYNLFFLGATDETLEILEKNIRSNYPGVGSISYHNGYFEEDNNVICKINEIDNNILFVGMGNPKQEIWIRNNLMEIKSNVILGVGGAFKIFSGEVSRAPKWIQSIGMEWAYRFLKEPQRLFKRYFVKYPKFIKLLINEIGEFNYKKEVGNE